MGKCGWVLHRSSVKSEVNGEVWVGTAPPDIGSEVIKSQVCNVRLIGEYRWVLLHPNLGSEVIKAQCQE